VPRRFLTNEARFFGLLRFFSRQRLFGLACALHFRAPPRFFPSLRLERRRLALFFDAGFFEAHQLLQGEEDRALILTWTLFHDSMPHIEDGTRGPIEDWVLRSK